MRGILRRWSSQHHKRNKNRPELMVEPMEGRTLMAAGAFSIFASPIVIPIIQSQTGTSYAVVVTSNISASRPLFDALRTLLANLDYAYGSKTTTATPPPTVTPETIQANVETIATLVGPSGADAVAKLSTDVNTVVADGTFTAQTRSAVASDVRSILVGAGISATLLSPAFGVTTSPSKSGGPLLFSPDDLTDPNAVGTILAGARRGQDTSPSPASLSFVASPASSGGLPGSGAMGSKFRRLIDDFRAAMAKSPSITPEQRTAITKDFAEIVSTANRPSAESIRTLRASLRAQAQAGALTDAGRARITADVQAVLTSAGVSDTLRNRAIADFQPILRAADLDPTALRKILVDIANVLTARPKSASPFGAWFLGGRPR